MCRALLSCKNQDAVQSYSGGIMLSVAFLPLMAVGAGLAEVESAEINLATSLYDKEGIEALVDRVGQRDDDNLRFTQQECEFLLPPVLALSGSHPKLIKEPLARGTLKYHTEKAKACMDVISMPTPTCQRESEPDDGLKPREGMSDEEVEEFWEAVYARLRDEWEPCFEVTTGTLDEGAECTSTLECIGDLSCVSNKRDAPLTCQTETVNPTKPPHK